MAELPCASLMELGCERNSHDITTQVIKSVPRNYDVGTVKVLLVASNIEIASDCPEDITLLKISGTWQSESLAGHFARRRIKELLIFFIPHHVS